MDNEENVLTPDNNDNISKLGVNPSLIINKAGITYKVVKIITIIENSSFP